MELIYKKLDDEIGKKFDSYFNRPESFINVQPGNVYLPRKYREIGQEILDSSVYENDVWLISYPRTGSTWAQEMVWLLANNFDFEGAKNLQLVRSPLLELTAYYHENQKDFSVGAVSSVQIVNNLTSPRFIKTHLPWQLLPKKLDIVKPKIIYVARNPKDLCVSYYYHCVQFYAMNGNFNDFCELFLNDRAPLGPVWPHIFEFWNRRHETNILFLKYEDMKRDLNGTIKKCAKFLNPTDTIDTRRQFTEENINKLCEHLTFKNMQNNPAVNFETLFIPKSPGNQIPKFIRKGVVGDWKNYMTPEMSEKFDKWILKNTNGTDLYFEYE